MKKSEIGKLVNESGMKKSFIATQIGISRQGLNYYLDGDGEVDKTMEDKILTLLPSKNIAIKSKTTGGQSTTGQNIHQTRNDEDLVYLLKQQKDLIDKQLKIIDTQQKQIERLM